MTSPARPVVTVIVPGYDVAAYAQEAIDSLRAQTLTEWRAILVDDASTDTTGTLFDEAAALDSRFEVVHHEEQEGLGAARNSGLDLVDTPLVAFLDADSGKVLGRTEVADEPYGVVCSPAGDKVYVTLSYPGQVVEIDVATRAAETPGIERAILFGAQQLLIQHRGLWDLLETRHSARRDA